MMNYPKYESYKDSGIDWYQEIPMDWSIKKVTHIFNNIGSGTTPHSSNKNYYEDGDISWLQTGDLTNSLVYETSKKITKKALRDISSLKIYPINSVVIAMYGATIGKTGLLKIATTTNQACCVLTPSEYVFSSYYSYLFQGIQDKLVLLGYGGGQPNISQEVIKGLRLVYPPLDQQNLIAKFLDQKTTQLDEVISIKEKQIELLKEQKQIMIQNAVTKGLDPNVKMKDSGVDWIGEIPEHWSVLPGFTIFKENKDSNKGMKRDTVLSLSYGNIIIKPEEKLVGLVPESFETYQLVNSGDIIIRCTDLQNDKTSLRTGIARDNGIITSAYINLRVVNSSNKDYVHEFLHVFDITKAIYKYGSGLRQNLTFKDFKYLSILQPSIKEQNEIVEFLAAISKNIEDYNELLQQQISKLKEYKSILINSAVTGKIKVTPEMVGDA